MKKYLISIAALLIPFLCSSQTISLISLYDGVADGITSKDSYMILSGGEIVNNANPYSPSLTGQYSFAGDHNKVITDGNYAFFGTGMGNDLYISDISNMAFPLHKSSLNFEIGHGVFGLDIKGNTLFVVLGRDSNDNGIVCSIDISNKSEPIVLDTLLIPNGQSRDIIIKDNYAFVAHYDGLKIIDISNVYNMELSTSIGSGYTSIDMNDNLIFLGKTSGGVDIFNIADPLNPSPAFSVINSTGSTWDIKYKDNHIYLATNNVGLFIYKMEGNSATEMASYSNEGQAFGLCLQDSLILLTGYDVSVLQYDSTGVVNVNDKDKNYSTNIYPNPAKNIIVIESSTNIQKIEIVDLTGKVIRTEIVNNTKSNTLEIGKIIRGVYFVRIFTKHGSVNKKLILE